jgi:hypothetical protein
MKLTDILRKINEEEEPQQSPGEAPIEYDLTIIPSDMQAALDALNNIKNYGIYSKNLANQADRVKVFGPSNPAQKSNAAQNNWDTLSPKEKLIKIEEIKERIERKSDLKGNIIYDKVGEKTWNNTLDLLSKNKDYLNWKEENGDNPEEYLITLNGKQANNLVLFGSRGSVYYPQKLGDEEVKYKPLQQDDNFIVVDNKIVFPLKKSPYKPKKYLKKVISLIMDNAGVNFEEVEKFQLEPESPTKNPITKSEVVFPVTYTSTSKDEVDDAKKAFKNTLGDAQGVKYEDSSFKDKNNVTQYRVTVTGLTPSLRSKLINTKSTLKEGFDFDKWEMRQMLVRAGIIK